MNDFSCAVGVNLVPSSSPNLVKLLTKTSIDTGSQANRAKGFFKRERPFKIDKGRVCESKILLGLTYDYPSGHSTKGWTWALLLSEMVPERAPQILARGRAYADSRVVCGAHNDTAAEAGKDAATLTLAEIRSQPNFQRDFAAARQDIRRLVDDKAGPRPSEALCRTEAETILTPTKPPFDRKSSQSSYRPADPTFGQ